MNLTTPPDYNLLHRDPRALVPEAEPPLPEPAEERCSRCADPQSIAGEIVDGLCASCAEADACEQEANRGSRWATG